MKKIMSVALAVICVLSCFYAVGSAESGSVIENGEFIKCSAEAGGLFRIPDGITGISENAFDGCAGIEQIYVPAGVEKIGRDAFANSGVKAVLINSTEDHIMDGRIVGDSSELTVIVRNSKDNLDDNAEIKCYLEGSYDWFAYDAFKIFGKTVLAFFYNSELDESIRPLVDELVKETGAKYIYFASLEDKAPFYVKADASTDSILSGEAAVNPGFFVKIIINYCSGKVIPIEGNYDSHPGVKGIMSVIYSLFFKKSK